MVGFDSKTELEILFDGREKTSAPGRFGTISVSSRVCEMPLFMESSLTGETSEYLKAINSIASIKMLKSLDIPNKRFPSYDGQAGAAGIALEEDSPPRRDEFIRNLYTSLRAKGVPKYAIPRLLRLTRQSVEHPFLFRHQCITTDLLHPSSIATGITFKQARSDVSNKAWDPRANRDGDQLYWLNRTKYERLNEQGWAEIEGGTARL
jgi:hypothetical protein